MWLIFVSSSTYSLVEGGGGELPCESVAMVDLLSDHFDSKQSWDSADLPSISQSYHLCCQIE